MSELKADVVPGKKAMGVENSLLDEDEEEQDTTASDLGNDSFSENYAGNAKIGTQEMVLIPEVEDRRATFTFLFNEDCDVQDREFGNDTEPSTVNEEAAHTESAGQDATITGCSQTSQEVPVEANASEKPLAYLELPSALDVQDDLAFGSDKSCTVEVGAEQSIDTPSNPAQLVYATMDEDTALEADASTLHGIPENKPQAPAADGVSYPPLPQDPVAEEPADDMDDLIIAPQEVQDESFDLENDAQYEDPDENFTEASLQINIQRDMQLEEPGLSCNDESSLDDDVTRNIKQIASHEEPPRELSSITDDAMDDITSGLTLGPVPPSREPTPRKLRSPSPPPRSASGPDDATMTFAFDDDTALLKDFLSRAAASKANKAEVIARRESLQNRRDSDVVRHALASPRKALEDKDPNSPSKYDNETTLNLSQTLTLDMESAVPLSPSKIQAKADVEDVDDSKEERSSRRSSRARKSRLPAPLTIQAGPPKISVKRDGGDPVILKKTDAQELSLLTRANTRKNKQGAVAVNVRLLKLSNEARTSEDNSTVNSVDSAGQVQGKKYVRWDSQLAYFQEDTEAIANALADAESLATPDELSMAAPAAKPSRVRVPKVDKNSTPKVRKVKNLGSKNGTPGKGLLAPVSLLPDAMLVDKEEREEKQRIAKPKTSRIKRMSVADAEGTSAPAPSEPKLPVLEVAPVGIDSTKTSSSAKERKSRLATPRKVRLPQLSSAAVGDGKENQGKAIAAGAPKKSIPMPAVVVPPTNELGTGATGLPRRRARKL